jgi:hypothetical protein
MTISPDRGVVDALGGPTDPARSVVLAPQMLAKATLSINTIDMMGLLDR